jgi:cysteine desulfurase/selenocysteine lyase
VALRGGHHCAQPLLRALGIAAAARASLALYNVDADIDALLEGVEDLIESQRKGMPRNP